LLYVNPSQDAGSGSQELQHYLSFYYGADYPMENTGLGEPDAIAAKIRGFGDAGSDLVILGLPGPDLEKLEVLGREVAPLVE
jgi:hypothetical protein